MVGLPCLGQDCESLFNSQTDLAPALGSDDSFKCMVIPLSDFETVSALSSEEPSSVLVSFFSFSPLV